MNLEKGKITFGSFRDSSNPIEMAVKTTIQTLYVEIFLDNYENAD